MERVYLLEEKVQRAKKRVPGKKEFSLARIFKEIKKAYLSILKTNHLLVIQELPEVYRAMTIDIPIETYKSSLIKLAGDGKIDLYHTNDKGADKEKEFSIKTQNGTIYYLSVRLARDKLSSLVLI